MIAATRILGREEEKRWRVSSPKSDGTLERKLRGPSSDVSNRPDVVQQLSRLRHAQIVEQTRLHLRAHPDAATDAESTSP